MVPVRLEMTCGVQRDPVFGPVVAVGLGGILIEVLSEAAMLRPPFTEEQARHAIRGLMGGRLAAGGRGLSEAEQVELARLMIALGDLALELEEVVEVDVNPVMVADGSIRAADALIVVAGSTGTAGPAGTASGAEVAG
jgi:acetyltransferase